MKREKPAKIIRKVAKQNGVSVREVRREIQNAIDIAYENKKNDYLWKKWRGRKPTVDEFIVAMTDETFSRLM